MSEEKLDELEQKKQELERELEQIQKELDHSIDDVRTDMTRSFAPRNIIRNYPLPTVGASLLVGYLLGRDGERPEEGGGDGVSSTLLAELKRLATRKAIRFATDYIEEMLEEKVSGGRSSNGTAEEA